MQTPRVAFSVGVVQGKVYALGGTTGVDSASRDDSVEVYDPQADQWSALDAMPHGRTAAATAVIDGKIYLAGGSHWTGTTDVLLDAVDVFDPSANIWTQVAPLPEARTLAAGAVVQGKMYAIGGRGSTLVEVYDPTTDAWQSLAPLPEVLEAASAEAVGNTIFLAGGWDEQNNTYSKRVYAYDVASNTWTIAAPFELAVGRCSMADGLLDDRYVVLAGGYVDYWPPNQSQVDVLDTLAGTNVTMAPLPAARSAPRAAVVGTRLFVMGGGVIGQPYDNPYVPQSDVWEFVPDP
jgi:N-acetylneuraminic acid mutarotase